MKHPISSLEKCKKCNFIASKWRPAQSMATHTWRMHPSVSEHPHKGPCSYDIKGECQGELLPVSEQKECHWCKGNDITCYDEFPNSYGFCNKCGKAWNRETQIKQKDQKHGCPDCGSVTGYLRCLECGELWCLSHNDNYHCTKNKISIDYSSPHCSISKEGEITELDKLLEEHYQASYLVGLNAHNEDEGNRCAEIASDIDKKIREYISKQIQLSLQEEREAKTQLIKKLYKDVRVLNFRGVRTESLTDEVYNEAIDDVLSILIRK